MMRHENLELANMNGMVMNAAAPKEPNEIPQPSKNPERVPPEEPQPKVWPQKEPEIQPEKEPLTVPPPRPTEIPAPPES